MKVAVFHPGTQHSWQTALALQQLDLLQWYATSIFYQPDRLPYRLERWLPGPLGRRLHEEFRRFSHPGLDPTLIRTSGFAEWLERLASRMGQRELARRIDAFGNRRFVTQIAREMGSSDPFALWGYNGSSLSSFELAKQYGRQCILDRTIGDFRIFNTVMSEILDEYGEWFLPVEREVSAQVIEADEREYALADRILVGCPYAAQTIRQAVADPAVHAKIKVLDYCFDEALFANIPAPRPVDRNGPVKFLFLGLAIPRKGIHLLMEAIEQIPVADAELTIVGDMKIPATTFARYADRVNYRPTVARADVPAIMRDHHVLLLPSYFEGAGIVLYEALAAGCALIQSDRCALVVTSETGIMLERLDSETLHAAMVSVIRDRAKLDYWRSNAQTSAMSYSFARYRDNIAGLLADMAA
jgi:glycosyltransferase involved in cell wall biosynthesis